MASASGPAGDPLGQDPKPTTVMMQLGGWMRSNGLRAIGQPSTTSARRVDPVARSEVHLSRSPESLGTGLVVGARIKLISPAPISSRSLVRLSPSTPAPSGRARSNLWTLPSTRLAAVVPSRGGGSDQAGAEIRAPRGGEYSPGADWTLAGVAGTARSANGRLYGPPSAPRVSSTAQFRSRLPARASNPVPKRSSSSEPGSNSTDPRVGAKNGASIGHSMS